MKKPIIIGTVAVLTIGFAFFGYTQVINKNGGSQKDVNTSVEYILVEGRDSEESFTNKGTIELRDVNTQYASCDGKILEMNFEVGDYVVGGDILYTYDKDALEDLETSLKDAEINLRVAKINLENSKSSYDSLNETVKVTDRDLLPLESSVYSAETTLDEYNRQLDTYDDELLKASDNIKKAKTEFEKQKLLFENGIITKNELDTFEKAITDQEDAYEKVLAQKENLEYTINSAKYNLEIANKNLEYAKNPEKVDVATQKEQALNAIELSEISVEQAEFTLEKIQKKVNDFKSEEISDFTGVITNIYVPKGTVVQKGMQVMDVTDIGKENLIAVLNVDQKNISSVEVGQEVKVTSTGIGDEVVIGEVTKVMPTATVTTTASGADSTTKVEVSFKEDVKGLKAGFVIDCKVVTSIKENITFLPIASVLTDENGEHYVFVIGEGNVLEKKIVETGVVDGLDVEVTNVNSGDKVATSGLDLFIEGDIVTPVEAETEAN